MAIARALVHPPKQRTQADREAIVRNAAQAGLLVELPPEHEPEAVEVFPDHEELIQVARRMGTQLNVSMSGVIGWRHEALPHTFRMLAIPLARQRDISADLHDLELMIVDELNKKGAKK